MKLYSVITYKIFTKFKYIVGTQYVFYDAKLRKSPHTKHALSEIWRKGIRIKVNETM